MIALSQIRGLVEQLEATGSDESFATLCFPSPYALNGECIWVNLQFAIERGIVGMEWVLLADRNIEDQDRITNFMRHRGHTVASRELNKVRYLRVEDGDLAGLAALVITECYEYPADFRAQLVVQGFQWDGRFQMDWDEVPNLH